MLWLPVVVCLAAIFTFATRPAPFDFHVRNEDKVRHLFAFGTLAALTLRAALGSWSISVRSAASGSLGGVLACAILVEIVQMHIPRRSAEVADIVAGMAGAVLLVAACLCVLRRDSMV